MSNLKLFASLSAIILFVWITGALYLDKKTSMIKDDFLKKKELSGRYEALGALWSKRASKEAIKHMETIFRMYSISPKTEKKGGNKVYTFHLDAAKADKVLGKILNNNIIIRSFFAKRVADNRLEVRLEVAL